MKKLIFVVILCFVGMTLFAQGADMSLYTADFMRQDASFNELLQVVQTVSDNGTTGIGDFWHACLTQLIRRIPDATTVAELDAVEKLSVIICQKIGAERHTAAAGDLWQISEIFDVFRTTNEAHAQSTAITALGQVNGAEFVPHMALRLSQFNSQSITNAEARRRVQEVVVALVGALEALKDIAGFTPVFFASIGSYDVHTRTVAHNALPNIAPDPSEPIIVIIRDPDNDPRVKLAAWREMLRAEAPDASKANVASAALAVTFSFNTTNRSFQGNLKEMRKGALDWVRRFGAADESVYVNLKRTYDSNFVNRSPDYEEISLTLTALATLRTEEASDILLGFLRELHTRRRSGPWAQKERQVYEWLIASIGNSGSQSQEMRQLLTTITRTDSYTNQEQTMARNALTRLGG